MRCLCGYEFSPREWEEHRQRWIRHGVCLYKVGKIRADRSHSCACVPISADPRYYFCSWLRLRKKLPMSLDQSIIYTFAMYCADSDDFVKRFMGEIEWPSKNPA